MTMVAVMNDADDDEGSVPGLLTAVRLETGEGQYWVGRECISALVSTGSHDDCSLWSHSPALATHSRVSACHQVQSSHQPSASKHDTTKSFISLL